MIHKDDKLCANIFLTFDESAGTDQCSGDDQKLFFIQYNTTLLPSVNTVALGVFCGAKYTPNTFMPIIKHHLITTASIKHLG